MEVMSDMTLQKHHGYDSGGSCSLSARSVDVTMKGFLERQDLSGN